MAVEYGWRGGFSNQEMNVLRHDDVPYDFEVVLQAHFSERTNEDIAGLGCSE